MADATLTITDAAKTLRAGGVVGMPTETVYGLAADARSERAVRRVFELKGRPSTNPLIVHVASVEIAERFAVLNDAARALFHRFSPGPLTIVLPRVAGQVCDLVTAGLDTVGIRIPDHPLALDLLRAFDGPLAAPSANKSNHVSPTTADHVRAEFGDAVPVLDGGACRVGIESTVLDLSRDVPRILRPGSVTREQIESVIGVVNVFGGHVDSTVAAASPGQQRVHYAPRTPAYRFDLRIWQSLIKSVAGRAAFIFTTVGVDFHSSDSTWVREIGPDPSRAMKELYAALRDADRSGAATIYVEMPPDEPRWAALRDRISRATRPIEMNGPA